MVILSLDILGSQLASLLVTPPMDHEESQLMALLVTLPLDGEGSQSCVEALSIGDSTSGC